MFKSNVTVAAPWDCWDFVALALAVFTAVWVFALKLKTFYDLGYSGDLFAVTQLLEAGSRGGVYSTTTALVTILLFTPTFFFSRSDL